MKSALILHSDLLDILFENRNKDYGAYTLRKYYHIRLYKSLAIIFFLAAGLFFLGLFQKKSNNLPVIYDTSPGYIPPAIPPVNKKKLTEKQADPKRSNTNKLNRSDMLVSRMKLIDNREKSTKLTDKFDSIFISNESNSRISNHKQIVSGDVLNEVEIGQSREGSFQNNMNSPTDIADIMPSYPGGEEALIDFLNENLRNPRDLDLDETVSVSIKFIVDTDGLLIDFETIESGGRAFSNEVIRVLKKMPRWSPGSIGRKNVSVYYTIPVKFIAQ